MDVKNLLGKLQTPEGGDVEGASPQVPKPPKYAPKAAVIEDRMPVQPQVVTGGRETMSNQDEGIILDLGEGISLNIPIQRRMSLTDFIKLAEKIKALEMLSESSEVYRKGPI